MSKGKMSSPRPLEPFINGGHPNGLAQHPWPERTSSLPLYSGHSIKRKPVPNAKKNKIITVAISGCSSSGKTTIAILLAEIFSVINENVEVHDQKIMVEDSVTDVYVAVAGKEHIEPVLKGEKGGEAKVLLKDSVTDVHIAIGDKQNVEPYMNGEKGGDAKVFLDVDQGIIIIHQDAYFLEKFYCPLTTFTSTAADLSFMQKTLADDQIGSYIMSQAGSRMNSSSSSLPTTKVPGCSSAPVWRITGPDTDCWSALDIPSLTATLQYVRRHGSLSEASLRRDDATRVKLPGLLLHPAQRDALLAPHSALIAELKGTVREWTMSHVVSNTESRSHGLHIQDAIAGNDKDAFRPKLAFVEGFLLFPDPADSSHTGTAAVKFDKENARPSENALGDEHGTPEERSAFQTAEKQAEAFQAVNASAKTDLMPNFDIKLFLPLSKEQAKERRFRRECYVDAPAGVRVPGQMWKTDGYFEEVAWGNHVKECGWLFEGGDVQAGGAGGDKCVASTMAEENGVRVRPGLNAGVEETVRWAVEAILEELGKMFGNEESVELVKGYVEDERDYEDDTVEEGETEGRAKKNIFCEKIIGLKDRLVGLITNKNGHVNKTSAPTKRRSVFSMGKGKGVGDINGTGTESESGTKSKKRDIGLKTILGSGNANKGFFSPKV